MGKDVLRKRPWPILRTVPVLSGERGGKKPRQTSEFSCLVQEFNPGFLEHGAVVLLTSVRFRQYEASP